MKFMMTAIALAIAMPALAQAADPHAGHANHKGHAPAKPQGTSDCCEKTAQGTQKDCCDKSKNGGKPRDCCDKAKAGKASGHDAHAH
jgi:hypothetical protein